MHKRQIPNLVLNEKDAIHIRFYRYRSVSECGAHGTGACSVVARQACSFRHVARPNGLLLDAQ